MRNAATAVFFLLSIGVFTSVAEDWKKIARDTDEPAFGQQVIHVLPQSQAERIGLKVGDFVVQVGEQQVRGFGIRNFNVERAFFFVPKGGKSDYAAVEGGKVGYHLQEMFRPWVAYLRGEIGTPSEKWEDAVSDALLKLHDEPEVARSEWEAVRESGYPEDEMDAFVKAYIAWRLGEPIPVREAYEKVHEEFEIMPAIYFAKLEDMAMASAQTDVLRKLRELDPESSNVSERLINAWDKIDAEDIEPIDFLSLAEKRCGKDITAKLGTYKSEKTSARLMSTNPMMGKVMSASPGSYQYYRGEVPKGVKDLHCRFRMHASATGFHDRWSSRMRIGIFASNKDQYGDFGSSTLGRIGVGEDRYGGSYIFAEGGHGGYRKAGDVDFENGIRNSEEKTTIKKVDFSRPPIQFDIVCIDSRIAAYCNGVCYLNLSFAEGINELALGLHVCGMSVYPKSFQVWELNPEK